MCRARLTKTMVINDDPLDSSNLFYPSVGTPRGRYSPPAARTPRRYFSTEIKNKFLAPPPHSILQRTTSPLLHRQRITTLYIVLIIALLQPANIAYYDEIFTLSNPNSNRVTIIYANLDNLTLRNVNFENLTLSYLNSNRFTSANLNTHKFRQFHFEKY